MKLNKAGLIEMIDAIETSIKAQQDEYDQALIDYQAVDLNKWRTEELPKWKVLRDLLTAKLKTRSTITRDEIQALGFEARYGDLRLPYYTEFDTSRRTNQFELNGKKYDGYPNIPTALGNLRKALSVIADDEVSTSALANLGFRNLDWFFTRAARAEVGI